MPAYLARLKADQQIVGVYFVDDDDELFWLVDECCDPGAVEITELGWGGIHWSSSIDWKVPIPTDDEGESPYSGLPANASYSGTWADKFFSETNELYWRPVPVTTEFED